MCKCREAGSETRHAGIEHSIETEKIGKARTCLNRLY